MEGNKNAVEKQLDYLTDLWNEFTDDPDAIILQWLIDNESYPIIDVFIETINEEINEINDLFMRFNEPYNDFNTYGFTLIDSLINQYETIRDDIKNEGIPFDWNCPKYDKNESDKLAFIKCFNSFCEYYSDLIQFLVIVLTPEKISDNKQFENWILEIADTIQSQQICFMLIDNIDNQMFQSLSDEDQELIFKIEPELNMQSILYELSSEGGGVTSGDKFRNIFLTLSNEISNGNQVKADQIASVALNIAKKENWPQMQIAVFMALGASYLSTQNVSESLKNYRNAVQVSQKAIESNDPAGKKILIHSRLAEASALFSDTKYLEAAIIYEDIAPIAEEEQDYLIAMESWRMASYCYEINNNIENSWYCGNMALKNGELIDNDTVINSTISFVGQSLLRLCNNEAYKKNISEIQERMSKILGESWDKNNTQEKHLS